MDSRFFAYLETNRIVHQTSCPYTSAQNGFAEGKNMHLLEDWKEALANLKWKGAMIEEMKVLTKNETKELVTLPPGKKLIGCKWVFIVKHKADGTIKRSKTGLVAKGFIQTYGVDYQEIFIPVAETGEPVDIGRYQRLVGG
ncbi:uncharacterized mitochondrial protein AtMg00820-like [Manihot esculenta]|uniref:uncharacterized mitochondrial protein AtMg00820-like n=1 Tax=Manihot esculenta TaxID=3983 RepID=UPI000B5D845D|nr:uncharacterized mitochondrial protein AtMg00820-like [Manihot esculenta]